MKAALYVAALTLAHVLVMLMALQALIWGIGALDSWLLVALFIAVFALASFIFNQLWRGPLPSAIEDYSHEP